MNPLHFLNCGCVTMICMLHDCIFRSHTNTYVIKMLHHFLTAGDVSNIIAKASSLQETFCGFAVGDIILKGTPVVPVVELESTAALTAVSYVRTSFDMVHSQSSLHRRPITFTKQHNNLHVKCIQHKFEWPGVVLSVRHPALDWNFDKLIKTSDRPVFSPDRVCTSFHSFINLHISR